MTINPSAECYNQLDEILQDFIDKNHSMEYAYIVHTHLDNEDNENLNHIHLVLYFKGSVKRFKTLKLAQTLNS